MEKKEIKIMVDAETLLDLRWMCVEECHRTLDKLDDARQQGMGSLIDALRQKAERLNDFHEYLCNVCNELNI